jgi:hypothetical protein
MAHWRSSRIAGPDSAAAALVLLGGIALALWLLAGVFSPVKAHSWYDGACCSERDCFELKPGAVTITRTGYNIQIVVNGVPLHFTAAQSESKTSQDEHYHICLMPTPNGEQPFGMRCFYAPPLGA